MQIDTVPNIVQTQDATLTLGFALQRPLTAGNWLRLSFPKEDMKVSAKISNCTEQDNQLRFARCEANLLENYIALTFANDLRLQDTTTQVFTVRIETAVHLPQSIKVVNNIVLSTQNGEYQSTSFKAKQGTLDTVSLKPKSDIVGEDTTLQLSLVTKHSIPKGGHLLIKINEYWNQGTISDFVEYFSSLTCDSLTVASSAGPVEVDHALYDCIFFQNPSRLQIEGAFSKEAVPANTRITVNLNGFKNPVQANRDFSIFDVFTTDSNVADVVDEMLGAPVRVSHPNLLTAVSFQVSALQTLNRKIVQEENIMELRFSTPVPLRARCNVSYWFPTDFFDAAAIQEVRTGSLFSKTSVAYTPSNTDPGRRFTLKEEEGGYKSLTFQSCPEFRREGVPESTRITGLRQPLTAEETKSIKVYVRDDQN